MTQNRIVQYVLDSFHELGKVVWPTKNRAINICVLVVSFVLISAFAVAGIDYLFHAGYAYLLTLAQN
ncbi:MAG: preprotein translocase subunit SecE [Patescibacteria group bacterium]